MYKRSSNAFAVDIDTIRLSRRITRPTAGAYRDERAGPEQLRQFKCFWNRNAFTYPNASLVESHVLFTLLTHSLVQLHLVKTHLKKLTNTTIKTLKQEERAGIHAAIFYHGQYFGIFNLDEYTYIVADLSPAATRS